MGDLNDAVSVIAGELGLDEREIDARKAFLQFTENDVAILLQVHDMLQREKEDFSDAFYEHLLAFPTLRALLPDDSSLARLKHTQTAYFGALTAGAYDGDYIRNRLRVGVVHQRIGLEPNWYIGAYRKYLSELKTMLWRLLRHNPEFFLEAYDAVLKVVCLDIGLAIDTYIQAGRQEVLQHQDYLEQVISGMPAGLLVLDAKCTIRSMNRMMQRMLGLAEDDIGTGSLLQDFLPCQRLAQAVHVVHSTGEPHDNLITSIANQNRSRHLVFSIRRTRMASENLLLLIAQDITFEQEARIQLQESEELFRLTFAQAAAGIAHVAPNGGLLRVNPKLSAIVGYTEAELLQRTFQQLTHPDDLKQDLELIDRLVAGEISYYSREKRYVHKDGHAVWVNVTVSSMQGSNGRRQYISVIEEISRRKLIEEELLRLANHDALTKLPNRSLLQDRLSQAISRAQRTNRHVAVMFIDLDRFKNINDSLGHDAGDEVIVEIARRLAGNLRESDTVARQGGDEFVVVLGDVVKQDDVSVVAQKILDALFQPMLVKGQEIFPAGSIGISLYPRDGMDSQTLLKNADAALYRAKAAGRNNFQYYAGGMGERAMDHLKLEGALRRALERNEFVLHYQPQIDIRSGVVIGMEALLRWHPQGQEIIAPADFIPIAEETGLIVQIGDWVLRAACAQHKAWREAGLPHIRVSVNLSARQFQRQDVAEQVRRLLDEMGCDAGCLALEITESVVMENPEMAAETLRQLRDMGVHLAIDDFGTGHSSLSYLKRFPVHSLKIDRSFVRDIATDADDAIIVKSVIALARSMKLNVIAEGVENAKQLDFLSEHGCDEMQGYFFSRPVPAAEIEALLRNADYVRDESCSDGMSPCGSRAI